MSADPVQRPSARTHPSRAAPRLPAQTHPTAPQLPSAPRAGSAQTDPCGVLRDLGVPEVATQGRGTTCVSFGPCAKAA